MMVKKVVFVAVITMNRTWMPNGVNGTLQMPQFMAQQT